MDPTASAAIDDSHAQRLRGDGTESGVADTRNSATRTARPRGGSGVTAVGRTTRTDIGAWWTTVRAVLPTISRLSRPWPRVPTTIRSAPHVVAWPTISVGAGPSHTTPSASIPAACSRATASSATCRPCARDSPARAVYASTVAAVSPAPSHQADGTSITLTTRAVAYRKTPVPATRATPRSASGEPSVATRTRHAVAWRATSTGHGA